MHQAVDRVEHGLHAGGGRIRFEADVQHFPGFAEPGGQLVEQRLAAQCREKPAVGSFEHVGNSREAALGQIGCLRAGFGGAAAVQPFRHRAFLRRHQPGAERAGDAVRVLRLAGIQPEHS